MLLAVEADEAVDGFPLAPTLDEPLEKPPAKPRAPRAPRLSGAGEAALRHALAIEGEMVHGWRCGPDGPPEAWIWTEEEIERLLPALEHLAERYGVTELVNTQGPLAVAGLTLIGHVSRSVAEERRWRRDQRLVASEVAFPQVPFDEPRQESSNGDHPDGTRPDEEPSPSLDRAALDRLSGDIGGGFRGGPA